MDIGFPRGMKIERRQRGASTVFGVKARNYLKAVPFSSVPGGKIKEDTRFIPACAGNVTQLERGHPVRM
jgi:hypothetical protein